MRPLSQSGVREKNPGLGEEPAGAMEGLFGGQGGIPQGGALRKEELAGWEKIEETACAKALRQEPCEVY